MKLILLLTFLHATYGNKIPTFGLNGLYKHSSSEDGQDGKEAPKPILVRDWPVDKYEFGQITGVAIDPSGNPAIFHRADRDWMQMESNYYDFINRGPIQDKTVYILDHNTGAIIRGFAEGVFYMPHGLTVDPYGNYWMTDVAMHQALKFKPYENEPILSIGKRFQAGSSLNHLCKPTSVAVATTGEIFVADGYCNSRILKFNAAGHLLRTIPQPPEFMSLEIPHGITLLEHLDLLCIADRENMRVVCPKAGLRSSKGEGLPAVTIQEPDLGRVFAVASHGDFVYAVNGPTSPMFPVRGFTIDPRSEKIVHHWGDFQNPHDIAIGSNGTIHALYVVEIGPNRISKFFLI